MRVLHVVGRLGRGGDSAVILSMQQSLKEQGVVFDFVTHPGFDPKTVEQMEKSGSKVWFFPGDVRRMGVIPYFFKMFCLLNRHPFEVVHFHTSLQSGIGLLAAKIAHVPVRVCHAHTSGIQRKANPILKAVAAPILRKLILYSANRFAACGKTAGDFLFCTKPYLLIANGIAPALFLPGRDKLLAGKRLREQLHIPSDSVVIGQVGRLDWMKNPSYSLKAASLLARIRKTALVYVGDGEEQKSLEQAASGLCKEIQGLQVIFAGRCERDEVAAFYQTFDCLLAPSRLGEGLPLTLLEAQAAGVPILASEFIPKDGDIGLGLVHFLPLESPKLWADAIGGLHRAALESEYIEKVFCDMGYLDSLMAGKWLKLYQTD